MPFRLVHIILLLVAFAGTGDVWGQEEGLASYYHNRFHGRKAASGRVHDADELVAAHRTYPFGTFLRVTNLSNMKRVIVCVTDRGPFRKGRIIDVSEPPRPSLSQDSFFGSGSSSGEAALQDRKEQMI